VVEQTVELPAELEVATLASNWKALENRQIKVVESRASELILREIRADVAAS